MAITMIVNGEERALEVEPDMPLLWALRETLGLTGTKFGCGISACGACTVHLNGRTVRSCTLPVSAASGLTFVGGTDDFRFRAFATASGEKLWEIKLPSSVETTPITYLGADGRQFVTVVSTGGGLTGSQVTNDEIIAFALPKP